MRSFTSYKYWIMESKKQSKKLDYGCVMLYSDIDNWKKHTSIIDEKDVYDDEFKDYGIEHHPHCTVLFGIHLDECTPDEVRKFMKTFKAVEVEVKEISVFECDDYDVVKYDVPVVDDLQMYHDLVERRFANTQSFPDYHPHMTIAYVLKGEGKKYAKKVKPFKVKFDLAVYSFKSGSSEKERIKVKLEDAYTK